MTPSVTSFTVHGFKHLYAIWCLLSSWGHISEMELLNQKEFEWIFSHIVKWLSEKLPFFQCPRNILISAIYLQCIFMLIFVHLTVLCLERYWNINIMPFLWFLFLCRIHCLLCSVSRPDQGNRNWEKLRKEWLISREENSRKKKKILNKRAES